jgi:hypothetical protein
MSPSEHHECDFAAGRMTVEVEFMPDRICVRIRSPKILGFERKKLARFMTPIMLPLGYDPRPLHISGNRADCTGIVVGQNGKFAAGWIVPNGDAEGLQ